MNKHGGCKLILAGKLTLFMNKTGWLRRFQRHATAALEDRAVSLLACRPIIDAMAVAAVEPGCGAKPPNRVLDEPREVGGVGGVEPPRIDAAGNPLDDGGATAGGIAAGAVGVLGLQLAENAGAVQEIMH